MTVLETNVVTGEVIERGYTAEELAETQAGIEANAANPVFARARIMSQLGQIDQQKIRALTDALLGNSSTRLQELEAEAATLRAQL